MNEKKPKKEKARTVEIVRSYAYKLGRPDYSSADFRCEVRKTCLESEMAIASAQLDKFCFDEVMLARAQFLGAAAQVGKKPEVMTKDEVRSAGMDGIGDESGVVEPPSEVINYEKL
jgi:hypothetical protein